MTVYSCRADEKDLFLAYGKTYGVKLNILTGRHSLDSASLAQGSQAVSIITQPAGRDIIDIWNGCGVKIISTRTVGYDHIDVSYAKGLGMKVCNVSYTPYTVAEYTVMTMLMTIRKIKTILVRFLGQDYSLADIRGRELRHMTVGIIGTGKIGKTLVRILSGFGCRLLCYDPSPKESVKAYATYTRLEQLLSESDIISLHVPATDQTYHMINAESISVMKHGVIIVNMARGSLIDTDALIAALEIGQVSAAALDVLENEGKIYYRDFKYRPVSNHEMAILQRMPNVLMTPHTAFFTDEAVADMIEHSITSCLAALREEHSPYQI